LNFFNTGYGEIAILTLNMAPMNTRSAPINAWFWFAENSVKFKVLIGAKNGELSKLAAVANINNTPATFLYEFISSSSFSGAGVHHVSGTKLLDDDG
jgi:hypothetical protein